MYICPLCNSIEEERIQVTCSVCHQAMLDEGKVMDYFDEYSAYQDIEGMKLFDGYPHSKSQHQCPHLFYCQQCDRKETKLIDEIKK